MHYSRGKDASMMTTAELMEESMAEKKGRQVAADEVWITVRVPKDVKPRIDEIAAARDRSTSYIARRFITYVLADEGRIDEALQ